MKVKKKTTKAADWIAFFIVLVLALFRIWISYNTSLFANTLHMHDEAALMNMTENLLSGNWLGEYSQFTMLKGITYSLFCAFCSITKIPYTIWLPLVLVFAAFMFVRAIRKILPYKYVEHLLFLFLIYSPITFEHTVVQTLYRNALTVPLVLIVFAGFLGIYFHVEDDKMRVMAVWSVLAGIGLLFFWNLREDAVWIVPFVVACSLGSVILAVQNFRNARKTLKKFLKTTGLIILPFIVAFAGCCVICEINEQHYGVFALNDRTYTAFDDVVSLFIQIDYEEENIDDTECFMSGEKFEYIIDHSESLTEHKGFLLNAYKVWAKTISKADNVLGDHIQWAFRLGLATVGFYEDGEETLEYLEKVKTELEEQIDSGQLQLKEGIFLSSSTKVLSVDELFGFAKQSLFETMPAVLTYEDVCAQVRYSQGDSETIREWEEIVNSYMLYSDEKEGEDAVRSEKYVNIANFIIAIYQKTAVWISVLAFVSILFLTVVQIFGRRILPEKSRTRTDGWLVCLAMLLSAFVMLLIFTIFTCWNQSLSIPYYCSGAYILLEAFSVIAISRGIGVAKEIRVCYTAFKQ